MTAQIMAYLVLLFKKDPEMKGFPQHIGLETYWIDNYNNNIIIVNDINEC